LVDWLGWWVRCLLWGKLLEKINKAINAKRVAGSTNFHLPTESEWERESENRQQSNPVRKNKHDDDVLDGEGWTARGRAVEERTIAINRSRSQGIKDD